jgi:hypothetical protein
VVDFDKLLQESLLGVNKAFEQADADLHELVAAASQALGRVSSGAVEMTLRKCSEGVDGVLYELRVEEATRYQSNDAETFVVGAYQISARGYPVRSGTVERTPGRGLGPEQETFRSKSTLVGKTELQRHFEELMSNPDSPVIANAAFFMRRAAGPPY